MGELVHEVRMSKSWVPALFVIGGLAFIIGATYTPDMHIAERIMMFFAGLLFIFVAPDMRAVYGIEGVMLTFGPRRVWKVRIRKDNIKRISIIEYNAMRDFGGWGIKGGRGQMKNVLMWAWVSTGNRGLLIETVKGKDYLVGDEDPEGTLVSLSGFYPTDI